MNKISYFTLWCILWVLKLILSTPLSAQDSRPFSNPAIIYGTSFGNFFQILYKQQKYSEMLSFTSSNSIKKYGSDTILHLYEKMDFNFELKLIAITQNHKSWTMNYDAIIYGTKMIVRLNVIVENDSVKLILPDLQSGRLKWTNKF